MRSIKVISLTSSVAYLILMLMARSAVAAEGAPASRPAASNEAPEVQQSSRQSQGASGLTLNNNETSQFADMDLESLMQVRINDITLTNTSRNLTPAAMTYIDRQDIDHSGARSLNELLNIYVPDEHWRLSMWEPASVGFRGLISDRQGQYLLLVNGDNMQERTHVGVLSEMDQILLGDLNDVDVVRGPGSATYGPGAISGVISLQTYNGLTFQGTDITVRGGALDYFEALEIKHGEKINSQSAWFIYAGVAGLQGADTSYSPVIQGQDFDSPWGHVEHGKPVPYPFSNEYSSYRNLPQGKFFAEYDSDGFTAWLRYTNGGQNLTINERAFYAPAPVGWSNGTPAVGSDYGYQQLTLFTGYKHPINEQLSIDLSLSFSITDFEEDNPWFNAQGKNISELVDSYTEDKLYTKALLHWTPAKNQQFAFGVEEGHFWLGQDSWLSGQALDSQWGTRPGPDNMDALPMPRWQTDLVSFVGEYQWNINDYFTTILSGRADKHTFTDWMYSPRGALIWTPNKKDAIKLIASQSVRTNFEEAMKFNHDATGDNNTPETMKSLELRYERQQTANTLLAASTFYNDLDALGWDDVSTTFKHLGKFKSVGLELEGSYKTNDTRFTISHSIVKLVNAEYEPNVKTLISAANLGSGYDLANWPMQITKLTAHQQLTQKLSLDGSLNIEWGEPGSLDFENYLNAHPPNGVGTPGSSVSGWNPYGINVFLNAGAEYRFNSHATLRFDMYNIIGWFDQSLTRRTFESGDFRGEYRAEAPAVGLTFNYQF